MGGYWILKGKVCFIVFVCSVLECVLSVHTRLISQARWPLFDTPPSSPQSVSPPLVYPCVYTLYGYLANIICFLLVLEFLADKYFEYSQKFNGGQAQFPLFETPLFPTIGIPHFFCTLYGNT